MVINKKEIDSEIKNYDLEKIYRDWISKNNYSVPFTKFQKLIIEELNYSPNIDEEIAAQRVIEKYDSQVINKINLDSLIDHYKKIVSVCVVVRSISEVINYDSNNRYVLVLVSDNTLTCKISFWNEKIDLLSELKIFDKVEITGIVLKNRKIGYVLKPSDLYFIESNSKIKSTITSLEDSFNINYGTIEVKIIESIDKISKNDKKYKLYLIKDSTCTRIIYSWSEIGLEQNITYIIENVKNLIVKNRPVLSLNYDSITTKSEIPLKLPAGLIYTQVVESKSIRDYKLVIDSIEDKFLERIQGITEYKVYGFKDEENNSIFFSDWNISIDSSYEKGTILELYNFKIIKRKTVFYLKGTLFSKIIKV